MKLFSLIFRLIYKKIFYRRCIKIKISEKEFEKLFDKYKNDIYRLAYTYVNNQADALDIVQETAYQAYTSKDKIRDVEKFKSWILKITVNKAKDLIRKNKLVLLEDISLLETTGSESKASLRIFIEDLKTLTMDEKNIIVLKIYFEYTFEMIAEEVKAPVNTVKSRYYRALEKLKSEEGLNE